MNKEQSTYFKMFLSTQNYLDNQSVVWSAINRVTVYKNNFDELISRIIEKSQEANSGYGIRERKDQVKIAIALKLAMLSGALQAYAFDNENADLAEKVKVTRSEMERIKDTELSIIAKVVVGVAKDNLANLKDFGVNKDMLTEILTSVEDFNGLIGKPRSILNAKYVTLDTIDKLFEESNNLLRNKLDKIMLMFSESNPEFYNGYNRSRTIVDV